MREDRQGAPFALFIAGNGKQLEYPIVQSESNRVLKTGKRDMELVNQNKE